MLLVILFQGFSLKSNTTVHFIKVINLTNIINRGLWESEAHPVWKDISSLYTGAEITFHV